MTLPRSRPEPGATRPVECGAMSRPTKFEEFRYVRRIEDGGQHAYVFTAKVDGLDITGCDFLTYDQDGRISEFMVMVRPLKAAQALAARMAERYPAIEQAAAAWTPAPSAGS